VHVATPGAGSPIHYHRCGSYRSPIVSQDSSVYKTFQYLSAQPEVDTGADPANRIPRLGEQDRRRTEKCKLCGDDRREQEHTAQLCRSTIGRSGPPGRLTDARSQGLPSHHLVSSMKRFTPGAKRSIRYIHEHTTTWRTMVSCRMHVAWWHGNYINAIAVCGSTVHVEGVTSSSGRHCSKGNVHIVSNPTMPEASD